MQPLPTCAGCSPVEEPQPLMVEPTVRRSAEPRDLRALGVDLGSRRIGVALSDSAGTLATPYEVIARCGDEARDHSRLAELAAEADALAVIVGYPLSLNGSAGPAAAAVAAEVERMRSRLNIPVELIDERLTTVSAQRGLTSQGVRGQRGRAVIDKLAAAVLLQTWLDTQHQLDRRG